MLKPNLGRNCTAHFRYRGSIEYRDTWDGIVIILQFPVSHNTTPYIPACTVVPAIVLTKLLGKGKIRPTHLRNSWTDFDENRYFDLTPEDHTTSKIWFWSDNVDDLGECTVCHSKVFWFHFFRAMLCQRGLCRHVVSVCLPVRHVREFCQNE